MRVLGRAKRGQQASLAMLLDRMLALGRVNERGCWIYCGTQHSQGYGVIGSGDKRLFVHRLALAAKLGRDLAPGEMALHTCDVRNCFNFDHLYAGTHTDNMRDARERLTMIHPHDARTRLSHEEVKQIRQLYRFRTVTFAMLARRFHVHEGTIQAVIEGRTWRWVK